VRIRVISLDFAGVVAPKHFIDYFWFFSIPLRLARLERVSLYEAIKVAESAYWNTPSNMLEWYLPRYWLDRFGIDADEDELIEESLSIAEPYGDALEVVPLLAQKFVVVISTNTMFKFVRAFLDRYPQIGKSVTRVFSCIDMLRKPRKDRDFFECIAKELGVEPREIVHVGDDPRHDVEEPRSVGIRAFLIDRSRRARGFGEVLTDLFQLVEIVEELS